MGQPVLHFEIAGKDGPALQKYYDELFGWKTSTHEASGYGMVDTQAGEKGIGGGIMTNPMGHQMVTFYVGVDDLGDSLKKAEKLGGKTVLEPTKIPDGPDIALFSDPEGNVVGLVTGM